MTPGTIILIVLAVVLLLILLHLRTPVVIPPEAQKDVSPRITHPEEIRHNFTQALTQRALLDITPGESKQSFSSRLLDLVSEEKGEVLIIDQLSPLEGNPPFERAREFTVFFFLSDPQQHWAKKLFSFQSWLLEKLPTTPVSYKISCPHTLNYHQRRQFYRVRPRVEEPLLGELRLGDREADFWVQDISGAGLSLRTPLGRETAGVGTRIDRMVLRFPQGVIIETQGQIRNLEELRGEKSSRQYIWGVEFFGLSASHHRAILSYISEVQRQEIRRLRELELEEVQTEEEVSRG